MKHDIWKLVIAIAVCQMAGVVGSLFTLPNIPTWYDALAKPDLAPPGSLIGLVWVTLFTLMGISLYMVWANGLKKEKVRGAVTAFGIQLVLNAAWSFLFFGLRSPFYGLIGIAVMWMAIAYTMAMFWKVSRTATYLLVPYIAWVTFAGYLNFLIWQLNPH
ncbi:TspO/MBR family protein [uncultured archaeon]|nr:TspO/MBR family protein [uncultured archaeon]